MATGQPPFDFRIEGPDDWATLETAPNRWRRSVERLLDTPAGAGRLAASVRQGAAGILEDMVVVAQHTGVLLCLVKLGRDAEGALFYGSLTLCWYDSTPVPADLGFARLVAGEADVVEELDTPTGPGLLQHATEPVPPDWRDLFPGARAHSVQALVPVPGTSWTALVSGTVSDPRHTRLLAGLVRRMARSLQVDGGAAHERAGVLGAARAGLPPPARRR
jgi:ABC-type amino acid transport substrate-binding protein